MKLEHYLFRTVTKDILTFLLHEDNAYSSLIAKKTDTTYSHVCKVLIEMEKEGLVNFTSTGRIKFVELTSRGTRIAVLVEQLLSDLK